MFAAEFGADLYCKRYKEGKKDSRHSAKSLIPKSPTAWIKARLKQKWGGLCALVAFCLFLMISNYTSPNVKRHTLTLPHMEDLCGLQTMQSVTIIYWVALAGTPGWTCALSKQSQTKQYLTALQHSIIGKVRYSSHKKTASKHYQTTPWWGFRVSKNCLAPHLCRWFWLLSIKSLI